MKANALIVKTVVMIYLAGCQSPIVPPSKSDAIGKVLIMGLPSPGSSREYAYSTM